MLASVSKRGGQQGNKNAKKARPLDLDDIPEVPKPTRIDVRAQKRQKMLETQRNEKIAEEEADKKLRLQDL